MAAWVRGEWRGALIFGASGAGKSDLALRLMDQGWRLVADDRTIAWASGGRVFGRAPAPLSGLIEARGVGVVAAPALAWCEAILAVELGAIAERVPDPAWREVAGIQLPLVKLAPFEASTPRKLALWMQSIATLGASV